MRYAALALSLIGSLIFGAAAVFFSIWRWPRSRRLHRLRDPGLLDINQREHSLKRNYPILANLRFMLEKIRPEIRQYFLESDIDGSRSTATIARSSISAPSGSCRRALSGPCRTYSARV